MGKIHEETEVYQRDMGLDTVFFYDASKRQEYVCRAFPGALTSEAKWQIYRLSYNSDGTLYKRRYAGATDDFKHIADKYATYDYLDI